MHTAADVQTITKARRTRKGLRRGGSSRAPFCRCIRLFVAGATERLPLSDWPVWSAERKTDECNGNEEHKGIYDTQRAESENGIDCPI